MNIKLLFGALVFTAVTANAQVATINENFDNFVGGNPAFPQNGWSAILPPLANSEMPPAPMMLVYSYTDGTPGKYVSAYSGGNTNTPIYFVSPQIVAPAGDKTVSFKARKNEQGAPVMVQIGLASSPTDMTTFVPIGAAVMLTTNTYQTITRTVPSSSSTYLVIRSVSPMAPHTASDYDDFTYDVAGNLSVSDNVKNNDAIKFAVNAENTALQFVGKEAPKSVEIYSAAGTKAASGAVDFNRFDISTLQTGVYYILIETKDGKAIKSKFIKK